MTELPHSSALSRSFLKQGKYNVLRNSEVKLDDVARVRSPTNKHLARLSPPFLYVSPSEISQLNSFCSPSTLLNLKNRVHVKDYK